ncbi:alpha,alpha-trehalase TreF [uncultured Sphingomonas sp.]|uniref:alpha,alpha-trehalase TreF n=1 Tax=uncultured Sphingomonas sp. TaxID=158754 RepID=UPI0025D9AE47|nr:alpha,alpha-trehalase TreF [uncultured Sphingomonas sp.]
MMTRRLILVPMLALLLQAQAMPPSPADIYGPLFSAVQAAQVFPDGKTFADAVPREAPQAIMAAYAREKPQDKAALTAFVRRYFSVRGDTQARPPLRDRIRELWPILGRAPFAPVAGSSALGLDHGYVVPGDRFQEIYYWDSYFTMLGLKADGQAPLIEAMLADFVDLVERYGHVPNGTRTYYLSRSQPPFLALMMDLSDNRDPVLARRRLAALVREHEYWMAGSNCLDATGACQHVVRMPDGSLLNRYWDARDTPRDESWREDRETAAKAAPRAAAIVQRDLRAAAESGWDFSSRWLADPMRLETIHTTDIVPVDLNSLLWVNESRIAARAKALGDEALARRFAELAARRKAAIDRYLWVAGDKRFADWDRSARRPTNSRTAVSLFPLFAGHASAEQARAVAATTRATLVGEGGLRTTNIRTGQQWDAPNGWAPLQWVAVEGLGRYGEQALAKDIARRWIATVAHTYAETGKLLEKYDVEERKPGGGGEYPTQDGFGWTNGVTAAMLDRWPDLASSER